MIEPEHIKRVREFAEALEAQGNDNELHFAIFAVLAELERRHPGQQPMKRFSVKNFERDMIIGFSLLVVLSALFWYFVAP
jgi:hypothetical protein